MAGGVIATGSGSEQDFPAKLTAQVFICTAIAAFGGLMFGYDIGISGDFLVILDCILQCVCVFS